MSHDPRPARRPVADRLFARAAERATERTLERAAAPAVDATVAEHEPPAPPVGPADDSRRPARAAEDPSATTLLWSPRAAPRPGYHLGRCIGAGGFAEVFEAELLRPPLPPQRVALKRLLPGLRGDPSRKRQLRREAEIAARLSHDNIIKVFELLELGDELAIAMELVDGLQGSRLLQRLARRGRRLRLPAVAYILHGLFAALDYLETRSPLLDKTPGGGRPLGSGRPLVHADISLENLMLTVTGGVKLIDFGLAGEDRSLPRPAGEDQSLTALHQVAGKRTYAPPLAGGMPPGAPTVHSDLYAAGVCAWELLTCLRFPVLPPGAAARELGSLIAFAAEGLPEAGWRLLQLCLAADPPARRSTAEQGLALLKRLRADAVSPLAMGALAQSLATDAPWPPGQAEQLTATLARPAAPSMLDKDLLRRLHGAFCAHRVLLLGPPGEPAEPRSALAPRPGEPAEPRSALTPRPGEPSPATASQDFIVHASQGPPGEPPPPAVLRQALQRGHARIPAGGLCYRVQLPIPESPRRLVFIDPGPGHTYEPLAEALLHNLLCPPNPS